MGLLDSVIGAIGQPQGTPGQPGLLGAVIGLIGQGSSQAGGSASGLGGLAGLVQQFQQGGLGHIVDSWISTGHNLPVSADQLGGVLGHDAVAGLAQQLGLNRADALGQLSQLLPQVVDKLTPNGHLPQGDTGVAGNLGSLLGGLLDR